MKKNKTYETPKLTFVQTELFENVAAECWANPSLYCLKDPTDDDNCGFPGGIDADAEMMYADLAAYNSGLTGCNADQMEYLKNYLAEMYGQKSGRAHYLTSDDIATIMKSGGGNDGTPLKESSYIYKVRS